MKKHLLFYLLLHFAVDFATGMLPYYVSMPEELIKLVSNYSKRY